MPLLPLVWATACSEALQPTPSPAPTTPMTKEAPTPADPIPTGTGSAHDGRWLVILSSKTELGHVPEGARQILNGQAEGHPERLASSEFKQLQPCYEIVIAGSHADKSAAIAHSKTLTRAGIDNYPKLAGKWVGSQPRVEAYCEGTREPRAATTASGIWLAETHAGRHFMRLGVDAVIEDRALEEAPPPGRLTDEVWIARLPAEQLGTSRIGDTLQAHGDRSTTCTVKQFVSATRGTPHFGWYDGDKSSPGCGEPALMAELDCAADGPIRLASEGPVRNPKAGGAGPAEVPAVLAAHPGFRTFSEAARRDANGRTLKQSVTTERFDLDGRALLGVRVRWITGEGVSECGGSDLKLEVWALVEGDSVLVAPIDVTERPDIQPFDVDGDGQFEAWAREWSGGTVLLGADGPLAENSYGFCDCGC